MPGSIQSMAGVPHPSGCPAALKCVGIRAGSGFGPAMAYAVTPHTISRRSRASGSRSLRVIGPSPEARPLDGLAKILPGHLYRDAHLRKPGKHAVADTVAQGGFAAGAFGIGEASRGSRQIRIVGGNDGRLLVVVAGIQDQSYRIPYPFVGLLRAEII